jgi:nucleotide-binding universal stress UspA family protein
MQAFRKILFAADFSDNSKEAFRTACSVAVANMTRIFILHVDEPNWVPEEPVYFGQQQVQFRATVPDKAHIDEIRQKLRDEYVPSNPIDVEYLIKEGDPSQEILRTARETDCDLIVMGTHGLTGLRGLLAGSVAIAVLRGAHCPVLALRSTERSSEPKEIRVILHPTDFSVDSEAGLKVANELARDHGARLVLLHVATLDALMDGTAAAEIDPSVYRDALEDLRGRISAADFKQPVETMLTRGFAAESILETADEVGSDLIVMGTHGRTGLSRLLMGSVAEHVFTKANCPVLIIKAARGGSASNAERRAEPALSAH